MMRRVYSGARLYLLIGAALCVASPVSARDFYVATCGDNGNSGRQIECGSRHGPMATIQAAIITARDGDTVIVLPGVYHEAIDFFGRNITVRSNDGPEATVVDGGNMLGPLVSLDWRNGPDTLLEGMTLTHGYTATDGGALHIWQGSPRVTNCRFVANQGRHGAGVFVGESQANFTGCLFSDNSAGNAGGAVYASADAAAWDDCTFQDNTAVVAGGAVIFLSGGTSLLRDSRFDRNESNSGGAVANIFGATASFERCAFDDNSALAYGGAIITDGQSTTGAVDSTFTNNTASSGGAIHLHVGAHLTATDCLFRGNVANEGGGLSVLGDSAAVTRCTFVRNIAKYDATTGGGAIYNAGLQTDIVNCVFIGNTALVGGAIINFDSSPAISCSTFYANTAGYDGGAGLSAWGTGTLRIHNSILWANADRNGTGLEAQIEVPSPDAVEFVHSLVQGGGVEFGTLDADPRFVDPIGLDGTTGTGDEDLRLQHGSPAVDAGANDFVPQDFADLDGDGDTLEALPLDSANNPRFMDVPTTPDTGAGTSPVVDIGAYELPPCGDPDADGDGLCDQADRCPDTPAGEVIDSAGCSCSQLDDDGDGVNHCDDACPDDPGKIEPGQCGCGVEDTDTDGDLVADCVDPCPLDNPDDTDDDGVCDTDDGCPHDPGKTMPGQCGCGSADTDGDGDGVADCVDPCPEDNPDDTDGDGTCQSDDGCPHDPAKTEPGECGCGTPDTDSDGDGEPNCRDGCPTDPGKTQPGVCGCGVADVDSDGDGILDCFDPCPFDSPDDTDQDGVCDSDDGCPDDPLKAAPGACGCGASDTDSDGDGVPDCHDPCPSDNPDDADGDGVCSSDEECPDDPYKTEPGECGCGTADTDTDGDGVADCHDPCPADDPNDTDGDGVCESDDGCPSDPNKAGPGQCGCGEPDIDTDGDGVADCNDPCPLDDPDDSDGDGTCESEDGCPFDPDKTEPGLCGCGVVEDDTDRDDVPDCIDLCPDTLVDVLVDANGCRRLADFNGNGCVESRDHVQFVACLNGPTEAPPGDESTMCLHVFDGNGSGTVDLHDYAELMPGFSGAPEVVYVDQLATGPVHDGLSWCTAFQSLDEALASLTCGTATIRMAKGIYMPDSAGLGDPRQATFQLPDHVAILGGYAGCGEADPHDRDLTLYETVLSGDLAGNDTGSLTDPSRGENSYHVVTATGNRASRLDGVTITGGNANLDGTEFIGAGLYAGTGDSLEVIDCRLAGNYAAWVGGGLYTWARARMTVRGCTFADNVAVAGGGVYNFYGGAPVYESCLFTRNLVSRNGGGMFNSGGANIVRDCTFRDNFAGEGGAGMYSNYGSTAAVIDCSFENNQSVERGGGMVNIDSDVSVNGCQFAGNSSPWGGGLSNEVGTSVLAHCQFRENIAEYGGAIANILSRRELVVSDTVFYANTASVMGGATKAIMRAVNCTFVDNESQGKGGAMAWPSYVASCRFIGNSAQQDGGAIHVGFRYGLTVVNSIFHDNTAGEFGGAINALGENWLGAVNCTLSANVAGVEGGGIYSDWIEEVYFTNGILWSNSDMTGVTPEAQLSPNPYEWPVGTVNYSIIQGGWGDAASVGILDRDPLFVDPAGADGIVGTLDDDLRILLGSPAIDAGDNTALPPDILDLDNDGDRWEPVPLDYAGLPRRIDDPATPDSGFELPPFVDLGAYEFSP